MKCDQCEMLSINGTATHETGCPNAKKTWVEDRQEWVRYIECFDCGCYVEEGSECNCTDDYEPRDPEGWEGGFAKNH